MQYDHLIGGDLPLAEEQVLRVLAVGNDPGCLFEHLFAQTAETRTGARQRELLAVRVAEKRNAPPSLDEQGELAFRQAPGAVEHVWPDLRDESRKAHDRT